jgi:Cu/Ag efflux protein CusF
MKTPSKPVLSFAFVTLLVVMTGGCQSKHSVPSKSSASQQGTTYTYHLRGIIKGLPQPGQLPQSLTIKVGPIAHWVGLSGKVEPMMAMTMPYQLAHGVTLNGITTGDKVAFTYQVNWTADRMVITQIKPLPTNTVINFSMPADSPGLGTK